MRLRELLAEGRRELARAGVNAPGTDARRLLQHACGLDAATLIAAETEAVPEARGEQYRELLAQRAAGMPVSRILGVREFYGLAFEINEATLDPRPETELLVDAALADHAGASGPLHFVDVGTGSGAIAIALLRHLGNARCLAVDISAAALETARRNASRLGVADRFDAVRGDGLEAVGGGHHFIVTNPPYIARSEIARLQREVRLHDPAAALDGGEDGLRVIAAILANTRRCLKLGGRIYLEFGQGQEEQVAELARSGGLTVKAIRSDLAAIPRVLVAQAP
jgi:release factor glutamine methyltransferase